MLNEIRLFSRLFYYEHVEGVSSTTPITKRGRPLVYFRNFNRMISPGDFVQAGDAGPISPLRDANASSSPTKNA